MKTVLTIAGSDSSGGAGIQADLKTIAAHNCYGMSVITAVTAQNTLGVQRSDELSDDLFLAQLTSVLEDITPDAVKIGMICSQSKIRITAGIIERYHLKNIVIDPVMLSTSGRELLNPDARQALADTLFPTAALVTPNLPEAVSLSGMEISDCTGMEQAAKRLSERFQTAFLLKGGHLDGEPTDLLFDGKPHWYHGKRLNTPHTHGTGCTLSSAIACGLAEGLSLPEAVGQAKEYLTGAILHNPGLGRGHGPLNHCWRMTEWN